MEKYLLDALADTDPIIDPAECARQAGLVYVSDAEPGIRRKPWGRGVTYLDPEGNHVRDEAVRERIENLVIPPAWTDVWISLSPKGHIQATGRDNEGRKQYIYHPKWQRVRNEMKFSRTIAFGVSLPELRRTCAKRLAEKSLTREKVLAAVVYLLDRTLIRVGNEAYARKNDSFGLTTLRDRHVNFEGATCTFEFPGKSGKKHHIELNDRRLAEVVRKCRDVPGQVLFQYYHNGSERRQIDSADVNAYLKEVAGEPFTAKDFRTWGASVHAAVHLASMDEPEDEKQAKSQIVDMVKSVADQLGNTAAVCRHYYIHPHIIEAHEQLRFRQLFEEGFDKDLDEDLDAREEALLHFFDAWRSET